MQEEAKTPELPSSEAHDVMRSLVSAIRAVKLYPSNNPVYSQSVKKAYEALDHFLKSTPEYHVGVQKNNFTHGHTPAGKDTQLNKPIAQDLFAKGIREIVFSDGVTEEELLILLQAFSLSAEEQALKSGISSILWEKDATHIKVIEAGLDEVITTKTGEVREAKAGEPTPESGPGQSQAKKEAEHPGRTLVLGDLITDPVKFGAGMVKFAEQTRSEEESVGDRLYTLYQETGRAIREKHPDQSDALFDGLAQSALSLDSPLRDGLVAGKLYGDLDTETMHEQNVELDEHAPNELHEILTGRFSNAWNVKQVATLLKKSSAKKKEQPALPSSPAAFEVVPIPPDLIEIARDMAEYTPEEMNTLKTMSEVGMESDIIEAAVRTLIFLLPLIKQSPNASPGEKEIGVFSGVVHQLEDLQSYLLKQKDYALASIIMRALHMPVDPAFQPRLAEAIKKNASKTVIAAMLTDMRSHPKSSSEYQSAYSFLSSLEREATEVLLELLADETDRSIRVFLLDLAKDIGKNHVLLLGEHLSDDRWYFVRNIVSILGESKADQALAFLHKAASHKDIRIRQEVIKGLMSIGGKRAAGLLAKFLNDEKEDLQLMAIHGLAELHGIGVEEAIPLMEFLESRRLKQKDQVLTFEAIKTLAKIGGPDAGKFLGRYTRIRWWKPRKLQRELRDAAQEAMKEIKRRQSDGGRAGR